MSSEAPPTEPPAESTSPATDTPPTKRSRFTLPTAYTILFGLIVVTAIATCIIPAGIYALDDNGSPIPGTYQEVDGNPQRILVDSLKGAGERALRDPGRHHRSGRRVQQRRALRRH